MYVCKTYIHVHIYTRIYTDNKHVQSTGKGIDPDALAKAISVWEDSTKDEVTQYVYVCMHLCFLC